MKDKYKTPYPVGSYLKDDAQSSYLKEYEGITVYVDTTDFNHEIGKGNASGPHYVYNTLEEIKEKQPCVSQCGVIRAKLVKLETVLESNMHPSEEHKLSFSERYRLMETALKKIVGFTHSEECECKEAPIYECGCYNKDQWEIAEDVLRKVNE